jgi:hypothetical protein
MTATHHQVRSIASATHHSGPVTVWADAKGGVTWTCNADFPSRKALTEFSRPTSASKVAARLKGLGIMLE